MKVARILILGVALAAGGAAAFLVGSDDEKKPEIAPAPVTELSTVEVLIAKTDIGMGTAVSAQDLQWQAWPAATTGATFITKNDRPGAIEELAGAITRAPFTAGEPIREGKLIKANGAGYMAAILPSGMRAVSTEISPETGAGGFILPNDRVDVILSKRPNNDSKQGSKNPVSETILTNVRVLAIDQAVEEKNGQRVVVGKTATLELAPRQAETLAQSRQLGTLSLALRSLLDASKTVEVDDSDQKADINTVRFGVNDGANNGAARSSVQDDMAKSSSAAQRWRRWSSWRHSWALRRRPTDADPEPAGGRQSRSSATTPAKVRAARRRQEHRHRPAGRHQGRAGGRAQDRQRGRAHLAARLHHRRRRSARPTSISSTPMASS